MLVKRRLRYVLMWGFAPFVLGITVWLAAHLLADAALRPGPGDYTVLP